MLEPSFGGGDFLLPAIERLLTSWRKQRRKKDAVADLSSSIRAVELHRTTYAATRARIIEHLAGRGIGASEAVELADTWLVHGDFLLAPLDGGFDFVIGNPPYVRQELIPD